MLLVGIRGRHDLHGIRMAIRPTASSSTKSKSVALTDNQEEQPMPVSPDELETPKHDSTPTLPLCDEMKVRFSDVAEQLEAAKVQGYVEANFAIKLLDLARDLLSPAPFVR